VNLGHQWTGSVDDPQSPLRTVISDFGRNPMGAVDYALPIRDLIDVVDEDSPLLLKLFDHKAVVDDLFTDIDRRAKSLEGDADDINGPDYTGAEASGF
jgi:hypothetical protein